MRSVISTMDSPSRNETSACPKTLSSTVLMRALEVLPMVIQTTGGSWLLRVLHGGMKGGREAIEVAEVVIGELTQLV